MRDKTIDIAKGIGVMLVIFAHINYSIMHAYIYTFHMPLFFFLSGYLFNIKKYNGKEFFRRKLKTIILPYFTLGTILILGLNLLGENNSFVDLLIQCRFKPIWFLTSLFVSELVFYWLLKKVKNIYKIGIISLILFILGNAITSFYNIKLIWNVDTILFSLFFMWGGYFFRQLKLMDKIYSSKKFFIFLLLSLLCFAIDKCLGNQNFIEIYGNRYGIFPMNIVGALSGICVIIIISKVISKYSKINILEYIGKNSLVFFSLQTIPITIYLNIVDPYLDKIVESFFIYIFVSIIATLIICTVLYIFNMILNMKYLKKLIGK